MKKFGIEGMEKKNRAGMIIPILLFIVIMGIAVRGVLYLDYMNDMQNVDLVRQSVKRAAVECYAVEGAYPANVEYLEENYGIVIDHNKYYVEMDGFASNIMPDIEVYERY